MLKPAQNKIVLLVSAVAIISISAFLTLRSPELPIPLPLPSLKAPIVTSSPILDYLPKWVPDAIWETPQASTESNSYGELTGTEVSGVIKDGGILPSTNEDGKFEDIATMNRLGFVKDINLSADGPGASNWGYKKSEGGQTQIVIFRYSSRAIYGPDAMNSTERSPTTISVFVSNPY